MNTKLAFAIAAVSVSMLASAQDAEVAERTAVLQKAEAAFRAGDFDDLNRQVQTYMTTERRTKSGAFKIEQFDDGISKGMNFRGADAESQHKDLVARTESWVLRYPEIPLAHVLHARALLAYAYYFRGSGYSNTVPPLAWAAFEKYAKQAADVLLKSQEVASAYTGWHATFINAARSLGWPKELVRRVLQDGVRRNPDDYRLYHHSLVYFLPKWHGSAEDVDGLIEYAEKSTVERHGLEIYARLYSAAAEGQFKHRLYTDSSVKWQKMRQGLLDWNSRFPTEWNLNIFAYHACIAQDKATTRDLLARIGGTPILRIWAPNSQVMFSTCQRFAAEP